MVHIGHTLILHAALTALYNHSFLYDTILKLNLKYSFLRSLALNNLVLGLCSPRFYEYVPKPNFVLSTNVLRFKASVIFSVI